MFYRRFLCSIGILLLWSGSVRAESVNLYAAESLQFITENGVEYVYTAEGKPLSGAVKLPDSEGREVTYPYKNGQKNGVAVTYAADNRILAETAYENGHKNGVEIAYYPNGKPRYRRNYTDDVPNGEEILFDENGNPQQQNNYVNGILDGTINYFDRAGNLSKTETYKNGIKDGVERLIRNNSLMAEDNYVNGKINGVSKRYSEKYLTDEIDYVDGRREGWHKNYAEDGSMSETPYHNDMKNGVATVYWPDKKIKQITVYTDDQKNGIEQQFSDKGLRISSENYKNDRLDGVARYFDEQGEPTSLKYFENGKQTAAIDFKNSELSAPLYQKYKEGKIGSLLNQRNLWYRILWLGIALNKTDLVEALDKAMKMYAFAIDDMAIYQRFSGEDYANQTAKLYWDMPPFMYASAVGASPEILQKFKEQVQTPAADGTTPLQYAIRTNNTDNVSLILSLLPAETSTTINEALFYALQNGASVTVVRQLIAKTPDITAADKAGHTPLDYAVKNNASADVISALAEAGADIAQPEYQNLLSDALRQNQPATYINMLLDKGVAASAFDKDGKSALYYAVINNYAPDIREKLRLKGATWSNADKQALIKAAAEQNAAAQLQEADISAEQWAEVTDSGRSALQYAYDIAAPVEVLQYFAEHGVDINHQDRDGNTVLHDALAKEDNDSALKFIKNGAAVNILNNYDKSAISYLLTGERPAELAAEVWSKAGAADAMLKMPETAAPLWKYLYNQGKYEALKTVLDKAENPLALTDEDGKTLVELVRSRPDDKDLNDLVSGYMGGVEDLETLRTLVKQQQYDLLEQIAVDNKNINTQGEDGETLLTLAMKRGTNPQFLQLLLDKGADINQENAAGRNVLDMAIGSNVAGMAEYLIEHGADVNKITDDRTYMMNCKRNSEALTALLIKHNAKVSHVTADGETLLMAAVKNLNMPLIEYALAKKVNTEAKDAENRTAVLYLAEAAAQYQTADEAVRADILAALKLLAEHGANLSARNDNGQTILVLMAREHPDFYEEFAEVFVAAGGDPEIKDQYDKRAKDYVGGQ